EPPHTRAHSRRRLVRGLALLLDRNRPPVGGGLSQPDREIYVLGVVAEVGPELPLGLNLGRSLHHARVADPSRPLTPVMPPTAGGHRVRAAGMSARGEPLRWWARGFGAQPPRAATAEGRPRQGRPPRPEHRVR